MSVVFFPFLAESKQIELSHYPFVTKFVGAMQKKGLFSGRKHSSARAEFLKELEPFKSELKKSNKNVPAFTDDDFKYIEEEVNVKEENRPALHAKKIVEIVARDTSVADELAKQLYTEHNTKNEDAKTTTNMLQEVPSTPTIDVLQEILKTDNNRMNPAEKAQKILELLPLQVIRVLSKELASSVRDAGEFLVLKDIVCYGSDGKVFEQYDKLLVAKDVIRRRNGMYVDFTPYGAISYFEKEKAGLFLPSFALHCAVIVALYRNRDDPEVEKVLQQYKRLGQSYGWHNNNTIVDGLSGRIIHYPHDDDFPQHGGTAKINETTKRVEKRFSTNMDRGFMLFKDELRDAQKLTYYKNLTGLKNPKILGDVAEYFGTSASTGLPFSGEVCSAWLGCGYDIRFSIYSLSNLSSDYAARGVRRG